MGLPGPLGKLQSGRFWCHVHEGFHCGLCSDTHEDKGGEGIFAGRLSFVLYCSNFVAWVISEEAAASCNWGTIYLYNKNTHHTF